MQNKPAVKKEKPNPRLPGIVFLVVLRHLVWQHLAINPDGQPMNQSCTLTHSLLITVKSVALLALALLFGVSVEAQTNAAAESSSSAPFVIKTPDGKCEITVDTTAAPTLKDWAENKMAPVLAEWYPKIAAMLPSEGYTAPAHYKITFKPGKGVAFTSAGNVTANSDYIAKGGHQNIGTLLHEEVHVIQHFGGSRTKPGWLVEGSADYIRWFKYEPESHGADIIWMRKQKKTTIRYDESYRVSANFLNWVVEKYDKNLVTELNAAMRTGNYDENLWQKYTGKPLAELGEAWKKETESQLTTNAASIAKP